MTVDQNTRAHVVDLFSKAMRTLGIRVYPVDVAVLLNGAIDAAERGDLEPYNQLTVSMHLVAARLKELREDAHE